jgi:hypothetical protein
MDQNNKVVVALYLNEAERLEVEQDPTKIKLVRNAVKEYERDCQLRDDLRAELTEARKDNSLYAQRITDLERDLESANASVRLLQALTKNGPLPNTRPIELPHPPEFSGERKELLNFISKVRSKLAGDSSRFTDDQHKLRYTYGYLKGNAQNQIQPYVLTDKIKLKDVEALITILEAAFGDPDQVGTASAELDKLQQGNREFSQYYAEFQRLMAILNYDENAKKAALKRGLSRDLQTSLVYQAEEPQNFTKFVDLCMKLDYRIRAHSNTTKRHVSSVPSRSSSTPSRPASHPTNTNSGNYGSAPMDLSASQKAQNQRRRDERMAKGLCLYCGSADHFKNECSTLAANNSRKIRLAAAEVLDIPTNPDVDQGKE